MLSTIAPCNQQLKKDRILFFEQKQVFINSPFAGEKFWLGREIGVQISVVPVEVDRTQRRPRLALARGFRNLPRLEARS